MSIVKSSAIANSSTTPHVGNPATLPVGRNGSNGINTFPSEQYKNVGGQYSYQVTKECHTGNVLAFSLPNMGLDFYGAGESRGLKLTFDGLNICCLNYSSAKSSTEKIVAEGFELDILKRWKEFKQLVIPIADRKAPDYPIEIWEDILKEICLLKERSFPDVKRMPVIVYCQGGHGRTGTVLSIIYGITHPNCKDPIAYIRKKYCVNAVESYDQMVYIENVVGKHLPYERKDFTGGHGTTYTAGVSKINNVGATNLSPKKAAFKGTTPAKAKVTAAKTGGKVANNKVTNKVEEGDKQDTSKDEYSIPLDSVISAREVADAVSNGKLHIVPTEIEGFVKIGSLAVEVANRVLN